MVINIVLCFIPNKHLYLYFKFGAFQDQLLQSNINICKVAHDVLSIDERTRLSTPSPSDRTPPIKVISNIGPTGIEACHVACLLRIQAASRLTLTGTFFFGEFSPLTLIQEEQVVSKWQKNGH